MYWDLIVHCTFRIVCVRAGETIQKKLFFKKKIMPLYKILQNPLQL